MSVDEAKRHCAALNRDMERKRQADRTLKIKADIERTDDSYNLQFPTHLREEFEALFLRNDKDPVIWRAAKRAISLVDKDPEDWSYYKHLFFSEFTKDNYSYSYVQKILYWVNKWGSFVCRNKKTYFEPIPNPVGNVKNRIIDNHSHLQLGRVALPISPNELESKASQLAPKAYNWLYLSIWLGLRPHEIDSLVNPTSYRLDLGTPPVVWVYQTKLTGVPAEQRWKPIPLKCPEQVHCVEIITSKFFKRPLNKTIQGVFGPRRSGYSGRKAFTDLMLSRGNNLEAISMWLGHTTLDRTWRTYKNRNKVLL